MDGRVPRTPGGGECRGSGRRRSGRGKGRAGAAVDHGRSSEERVFGTWRGGRAVEGGRLEICCTLAGTWGSNPHLSATFPALANHFPRGWLVSRAEGFEAERARPVDEEGAGCVRKRVEGSLRRRAWEGPDEVGESPPLRHRFFGWPVPLPTSRPEVVSRDDWALRNSGAVNSVRSGRKQR